VCVCVCVRACASHARPSGVDMAACGYPDLASDEDASDDDDDGVCVHEDTQWDYEQDLPGPDQPSGEPLPSEGAAASGTATGDDVLIVSSQEVHRPSKHLLQSLSVLCA